MNLFHTSAENRGNRVTHITRCVVLFMLLFSLSPAISFGEEICSRAAVAMDAATGKLLYAKNPYLRCYPASTTKLMTAIVTLENADPGDVVTVSRNAARTARYRVGFREGDRVTIEELLYAAMLCSGNDAAVALSEAVAGTEEKFVVLMNKKATAIGATDTHFVNASGLPAPGQYITAADLAKIMNYALGYPKLRDIMSTRNTEILTDQGKPMFLRNTNKLLWSDENLVGGKTGYTNMAQHCFVGAVKRENSTVIVSMLGTSSRNELWKWSHILIAKGFDVMAAKEKPYIYLASASLLDSPPKKKVVASKKSRKASAKMLAKKKALKKKLLAKKKGSQKKKLVAKKGTHKKKALLAKKHKKSKKTLLAKKKGKSKRTGTAGRKRGVRIAKGKGADKG